MRGLIPDSTTKVWNPFKASSKVVKMFEKDIFKSFLNAQERSKKLKNTRSLRWSSLKWESSRKDAYEHAPLLICSSIIKVWLVESCYARQHNSLYVHWHSTKLLWACKANQRAAQGGGCFAWCFLSSVHESCPLNWLSKEHFLSPSLLPASSPSSTADIFMFKTKHLQCTLELWR